jgi:nucleotide-binding universal stress UspA family protein
MNKQILIATDGSTFSNQALVYAANLFADQPEVTFRLLNCISPPQRPRPEPEDFKNSLFPCSAENVARHSLADNCLEQAKERLYRRGIAANRITTTTITASNIARTIQFEAEHKMVDSILVARRGIGFVGEMLLGSVSADLFRKCHQIPLWIIDGEITSKNFLMHVDGSCDSLMAADHLAHILSRRKDIQIHLYHCQRLFKSKNEKRDPLHPKWDEEWCNTYLTGDNPIYDGPRQLLREAEIPDSSITVLPEKTNIDESSSIISQARKHRCGTIVMGRRRVGMARGIFGEVTARTIKNTQNMALWIVG